MSAVKLELPVCGSHDFLLQTWQAAYAQQSHAMCLRGMASQVHAEKCFKSRECQRVCIVCMLIWDKYAYVR